ncbi:MAG: filamentous hemagglutinin N-terminal domain-containing protein [Verrucomicrobiota bacterium]|nr:filamentous hemagglutinin N-terminal domain-containing protein [Verrucomicrobiota bacterium]
MSIFSRGLVQNARLAALALLLWQVNGRLAWANPAGGVVAQGAATFTASGSTLTISAAQNTFINWQSFNIGAGETTTFVQPSCSSLVWNQINDPNPSQILGNLNANGYVVLENPSGFFIGGQAAISTHGLLLTTASPAATPDLSSGGPWSFNTPPPSAKIVNYGQINIRGGGSAFLLADDIENNGGISAPGGKVGLYAGQKVLVSTTPDGRGLSVTATVPDEGVVNNQGQLTAEAGDIVLNAQTVNQNGLIQANSVKDVNGTIELVAGDSVNLGAKSVISADGGAQGASAGGSVTIKSENSFSDQTGSAISVAGGKQGGNGGQVEISAPQINSIRSRVAGQAISDFLGGTLTIDPYDILLNSSYVSSLNGLSQINLEADHNIELSTAWVLPDQSAAATLSLSAGNNIIFDNNSSGISYGISAGKNWNVSLSAGTSLPSGSTPTSGNDGIYLNGASYLQTQNGDISLDAANEVVVHGGAVRTLGGGSIEVTTQHGDVNTGQNPSGFNYRSFGTYYYATAAVGGISTVAGGNVTLNASGDVISYLPSGTDSGDAGTGAFGSQPGNVTITAGGSVSGHYVVVNGTGNITAGQDVGTASDNVALSLVTGSWTLDAQNGDIYLQEVRNPNGVFDTQGAYGTRGNHLFDYDPQASVSLAADNGGVYLTGQSLPRPSPIGGGIDEVPILLPSTLTINAGAGGVTLGNDFTLFPSPDGDLAITTVSGGGFEGNGHTLFMSDSAQKRWIPAEIAAGSGGVQPFSSEDHGSTPIELGNTTPVNISIAGNMDNVILQTSKATQINVGGNMTGCTFYGQNLQAGDETSITVAGRISNPGSFTQAPPLSDGLPDLLQLSQSLPAGDTLLPAGMADAWYLVLELAVDPAKAAAQSLLGVSQSDYANYLSADRLFPGVDPSAHLAYNPATKTLTAVGPMPADLLGDLQRQTLTMVEYGPDGQPLLDAAGHFKTATINWVSSGDASTIASLYAASQSAPALGSAASGGGYIVGGPGTFDISADSISLGNSYGILSVGDGQLLGKDYSYLKTLLQTAQGATINVTVNEDYMNQSGQTVASLNMPSSTIAALGDGGLGGGDVNVISTGGDLDLGDPSLLPFESRIMSGDNLALGIYTSGHNVKTTADGMTTSVGGNVKVTAQGDIDINSSRIATFNGGDITIESYAGNVDAGSGGTVAIPVNVFSPSAGLAEPFEQVYANGIVAQTLVNASQVPGSAAVPGNITVTADKGGIYASQGGILQEALNGNISAGPVITLDAADNIDLGDSGVIGGTVNLTAGGNISGLVISRQNSSIQAAQNFSGTVLSGGTANLSAGGTVAGTVIGVTGVNAGGGGGISATLLSQNVSANGGASQSTLGTSATATSSSQSAAVAASSDASQQVATANTEDEKKKKKKHPELVRVKRVTVILPKAS